MPEPDEFQHAKFPVDAVLFNHGTFSIAWGTWEGETRTLGMRWNGGDDSAGYPKLFGRPVWFILPKELTIPTIIGLMAAEHSDKAVLRRVLLEAAGSAGAA